LASETLSGVCKFEICETYIWMYVKHNSSVGIIVVWAHLNI